MIKFIDAINWMLNGKSHLLFFIIEFKGMTLEFRNEDLERLIEYKFFDYSEDSIFPVALLEVTYEISTVNTYDLIEIVFNKLKNNSHAVICMFEGRYINCTDLIDPVNADSIYAFQLENERILGFHEEVRASKTWMKKLPVSKIKFVIDIV